MEKIGIFRLFGKHFRSNGLGLTLWCHSHIGELGIHILNDFFAVFLNDSIEVEIEGLLGRQIARESFQRSAPHAWNHIDNEG